MVRQIHVSFAKPHWLRPIGVNAEVVTLSAQSCRVRRSLCRGTEQPYFFPLGPLLLATALTGPTLPRCAARLLRSKLRSDLGHDLEVRVPGTREL